MIFYLDFVVKITSHVQTLTLDLVSWLLSGLVVEINSDPLIYKYPLFFRHWQVELEKNNYNFSQCMI